MLRVCIQEIRAALGDQFIAPTWIETVGRSGYRFIGSVASSQDSVVSSLDAPPTLNPQSRLSTVVGRDAGLAELRYWLDRAVSGERQLIFIMGEPGIGKTTLLSLSAQASV